MTNRELQQAAEALDREVEDILSEIQQLREDSGIGDSESPTQKVAMSQPSDRDEGEA